MVHFQHGDAHGSSTEVRRPTGPHPTQSAVEDGPGRNHDVGLQAQRRHHLVRRANINNGEVYGECQQKRRYQEWLKFLVKIDGTVPEDKQIHINCDNYATHKHTKVKRWPEQHPRFHVHFTPTSASRLNMVERFFRDLTQNRIRREIFQYLEQLIMGIGDYIDGHNKNPNPFIWTAKACDILAKVSRAKITLNKRLSV
jgi:transposase